MRYAFDFSLPFRSTIRFDRIPTLLKAATRLDEATLGYPPDTIEKLNEDSYCITMAVAGFAQADLEIETREGALTVSGRHEEQVDEGVFLHRGIAGRPFQRKFQRADPVQVTGASLENGLLHIDLVREIPEAMKPRRIAIGADAPTGAQDRRHVHKGRQGRLRRHDGVRRRHPRAPDRHRDDDMRASDKPDSRCDDPAAGSFETVRTIYPLFVECTPYLRDHGFEEAEAANSSARMSVRIRQNTAAGNDVVGDSAPAPTS